MLRTFVERAFALGARHATEQLVVPALSSPDLGRLPRELVQAVEHVSAVVVEQVEKAAPLLTTVENADDLDLALAVVNRVESRVEATVVTQVHGAVAAGTERAAEVLVAERKLDVRLVWAPERDACLFCLELAGAVQADGHFRRAQSFAVGKRRLPESPRRPPLHPHCRCQLVAWNGVTTGDTSFPEALRREARRSVVKAWALPSEGVTARQRAAEALLARGAGLPTTVEARARAAVRSKQFKTRPAPA